MSEKLVLIDGHSILHRAFYGLPDLTNSEGIHTNAVYGFLNIMFNIMEQENPGYIAVAFDVHHPTFRHEMFSEYKGNRSPMPDELRSQVPLIKEVLTAMGILIMEKPGLEADDILGTMAKNAEKQGVSVTLVSGDRDLLQVASDNIKIRIPKTKPGRTEIEDYYAKDVYEKYKLTPAAFIDFKALMGDSADNYKGVPKVGEKTALELLLNYGSIDGIYENLDKITQKSIKNSLAENKDAAYLCQKLATIKVDADIDYTLDDAKLGNIYNNDAYVIFKKLDFKNLLGRFDDSVSEASNEQINIDFSVNTDEADKFSDKLLSDMEEDGATSIAVQLYANKKADDNEEDGGQFSLFSNTSNSRRIVVALCYKEGAVSIKDYTGEEAALKTLLMKLVDNDIKIFTSNVKKIYEFMDFEGKTSKEVANHFDDVIIGAYLLNPLKNDYTVTDIMKEHLGMLVPVKEEIIGKTSVIDAYYDDKLSQSVTSYIGNEAYGIWKSASILREKLDRQDMLKLYKDIEMPVSYVLYTMENEGVIANRKALREYGASLQTGIEELEKSIYSQAGKEFNINSPKQLGELLFEEMKIEGGKKTKTGYSTAADVLEKLAPDYPIVNDILKYRTLTKLKSTYADGLEVYIESDERIHTNFNQTITATGRISSTEPNLQNIPMRMELGRLIRKVFIPREGCIFADADYSQIELRILASMSKDKELINSYKADVDIHKTTASKVFHVPLDEVTDLMRRNAKAVNFGIVYGISSFGLSQDLSISRSDAKKYIEDYFKSFPGIKEYLDNAKQSAKELGYSVTAYGRRRPIPEIKSSNFIQRGFGERVAMNAPIQGTAADIMKIAMINVYDALINEGLKSKLILQVHDELVVETYIEEKERVCELLVHEMKGAADMAVELEVSLATGTDWYEAK